MKARKTVAIVLDVVLWVLIAVAALFAAVTLTARQNNGVPRVFGYSPVVVLSNSMKGNAAQDFSAGDLIFIRKADTSTLKVGDVVSFWTLINGKRQIDTHRIVSIDRGDAIPRFTTKGDNVSSNDADAKAPADIVGIYCGKIAGAGFVMNFLSSTWGIFFCLVLPLLAFFIWRLVKLILAIVEYRTAKDEGEQKGAQPRVLSADEDEAEKEAAASGPPEEDGRQAPRP